MLRKPFVSAAIKVCAAILAATAIFVGLSSLERDSDGILVHRSRVGSIPVTVFEPEPSNLPHPAPVVVIAHGFAGSQQLMLPFALTLAHNGYIAVTFDFPGHGQNPVPLPGDMLDQKTFSRALLEALGKVVDYASKLPESDGRLALLGHSMASDIVVRYAQEHPDISATVAVSLFFPDVTASSPRNLLIIDGALEPAAMHDSAYHIVELTSGGKAKAGVTYGHFSDGTARRLALARGVEHIGVLYSGDSMHEALAWLNDAFDHQGRGYIDARGGALGLLYVGLILLAWPLSGFLPRLEKTPRGAGLRWGQLLPVAILPAVLTPLILWRSPTEFLPLLLGDYLLLHFSLYGLLTAAGLCLFRRKDATRDKSSAVWKWVIAALVVTAYSLFAMGLPIDRYMTSFWPGSWRLPLILAMLAGTIPYFFADEWLTRGRGTPRGAYLVTKCCFLLSLVIAVGLNLPKLFFLIIIVPVILILFVVYGFFSSWIYRSTWHPFIGAFANAVTFAWFISVTFPIVQR